MTDSLSHQFIRSLDEPRDRLYTLALARESSPVKAEAALQKAVRTLFVAFAEDPSLDIPAALEKSFEPATPAAAPPVPAAMPADVWARLAAAIQIEAARTAAAHEGKLDAAGAPGKSAINPDSVLLNPDPLLAPKKTAVDDEGFDLSPSSRFVMAAGIAILIGIALTIYIVTRPTHPVAATLPATQAAATLPTSQPSIRP